MTRAASGPIVTEGVWRARDILRLPGVLSLCRLPLSIAFPFVAVRPAWALGVLAAAALTDVLDGWTARRLHQETPVGAVLDGVMDKVLVGVVFATLAALGSLTLVDVGLLATREIGEVAILTVVLLRHRRRPREHVGASALGKVATVLQLISVVLVIVRAPHVGVAVAVTAICGGLAAIAYGRRELGFRPASPAERAASGRATG